MDQRIRYAQLDGDVEVAYAVVGSGPFLVVPPAWVSHLELGWALPPERRLWERLAAQRTVVRYDKVGTGLSTRVETTPSLESELALLGRIVAEVGATRFELLGTSMAAAISVAWAAQHPETVERLVLYGGWARGGAVASPEVRKHVIGLVRTHWGFGSEVLADIFIPEEDARVKRALVYYQRESATPEVAAEMLGLGYDLDVVQYLPRITAPTLVLHRDKDRASPVAQGKLLAELIPGAIFKQLPGRSHLLYAGDQDSALVEIARFLRLKLSRRSRGPGLTARQHEIAALIAEGLTNRAIASRLSLEERSVEGHMDRIRDRLGLSSRAALAAWFVATQQALLDSP